MSASDVLETDENRATNAVSELSDNWNDADGELYDDGFALYELFRQTFERGATYNLHMHAVLNVKISKSRQQ
jgi:hypothetical protein